MAGGYWHISARNLKRTGNGVYYLLPPCPHETKINEYDEKYPAFSVYKSVLLDLDESIEILIDDETVGHFKKITSFYKFDEMSIDDQNVEIVIGTFSGVTCKCLIAMNDDGSCVVIFTGTTGGDQE